MLELRKPGHLSRACKAPRTNNAKMPMPVRPAKGQGKGKGKHFFVDGDKSELVCTERDEVPSENVVGQHIFLSEIAETAAKSEKIAPRASPANSRASRASKKN